MHRSFRIATFAALAGMALLAASCSKSGSGTAVSSEEMGKGVSTAKVTIVEYASVACPLCAHFNAEVMPDLEKKYIDSGKVYYVYRPMMTGNPAVAAAGHRLAECSGKDKYFKVIDAIMRSQEAMGGEETGYANAKPVLAGIAKSVGLSDDQFNTCITDSKGLARLNDLNKKYLTDDGIDGTPTFLVNGKKLTRTKGDISDFDAAIKPLLAN